jgi:hypothetical protein
MAKERAAAWHPASLPRWAAISAATTVESAGVFPASMPAAASVHPRQFGHIQVDIEVAFRKHRS